LLQITQFAKFYLAFTTLSPSLPTKVASSYNPTQPLYHIIIYYFPVHEFALCNYSANFLNWFLQL